MLDRSRSNNDGGHFMLGQNSEAGELWAADELAWSKKNRKRQQLSFEERSAKALFYAGTILDRGK